MEAASHVCSDTAGVESLILSIVKNIQHPCSNVLVEIAGSLDYDVYRKYGELKLGLIYY